MIKKLLIVAVLLVVVLLAGLGFLWSRIDSLAKQGLEAGGTYAMGVQTTVDSVSVSLLGGTLDVDGMDVANAPGFASEKLMDFEKFHIGIETGSLFKPVVVVPAIELDNLTVNIDQEGGKTNVSVITENLKKLGSGTADAPESQGGGGKKVNVKKITLRNLVANVQVLPIGGKASTIKVEVPELVFDDISSDEGIPPAEVFKRVWPAILAAIVNKGGDLIPKDLLNDLAGNVGELAGALGEDATKMIGQLGGDAVKNLQNLSPELGGALKGVTENLGGDVGKTVKDGLGNLIPGGDKTPAPDGATEEPKKEESPIDGIKKLGEGLLGK